MLIHLWIDELYYREVSVDVEKPDASLLLRNYGDAELICWRKARVEMYPATDDEFTEMMKYRKKKMDKFGIVSTIKKPSRVHAELAKLKAATGKGE